MRETMIDGLSGPIRAVESGSGDGIPVLFVHSFAGSSAQWSPQLKHASETRRAVAIDLHGHGRSDASTGAPYDVGSFADDIAAAADGLGLERFVLVGHSLGGAAAISYAADYPQRVAGLVLVATPGRLPDEQVRGILGSLDRDYDGTMTGIWKRLLTNATPATRRTVEGESDRMPEKVARKIIGATFEFDPVPPLEAYQRSAAHDLDAAGRPGAGAARARPRRRPRDGRGHEPLDPARRPGSVQRDPRPRSSSGSTASAAPVGRRRGDGLIRRESNEPPAR